MYVCTDLTLVYTLIHFGGMEREPMLTPKGKIPSTGKFLPRGVLNPTRRIKQDNKPKTPNSWAVLSYHVVHDIHMLHVISTQCVANDFHMTAPWPPERTVGDSLWHSEKSVKILKCTFQCDYYYYYYYLFPSLLFCLMLLFPLSFCLSSPFTLILSSLSSASTITWGWNMTTCMVAKWSHRQKCYQYSDFQSSSWEVKKKKRKKKRKVMHESLLERGTNPLLAKDHIYDFKTQRGQ